MSDNEGRILDVSIREASMRRIESRRFLLSSKKSIYKLQEWLLEKYGIDITKKIKEFSWFESEVLG